VTTDVCHIKYDSILITKVRDRWLSTVVIHNQRLSTDKFTTIEQWNLQTSELHVRMLMCLEQFVPYPLSPLPPTHYSRISFFGLAFSPIGSTTSPGIPTLDPWILQCQRCASLHQHSKTHVEAP